MIFLMPEKKKIFIISYAPGILLDEEGATRDIEDQIAQCDKDIETILKGIFLVFLSRCIFYF